MEFVNTVAHKYIEHHWHFSGWEKGAYISGLITRITRSKISSALRKSCLSRLCRHTIKSIHISMYVYSSTFLCDLSIKTKFKILIHFSACVY